MPKWYFATRLPPTYRANVERRHLTASQRAMIAAKLANLKDGQRKSASPIGEAVSQDDAAKMLNVGKRTVERAKKVLESGDEALVGKVERGVVTVGYCVICAWRAASRRPAASLSEPGRVHAG